MSIKLVTLICGLLDIAYAPTESKTAVKFYQNGVTVETVDGEILAVLETVEAFYQYLVDVLGRDTVVFTWDYQDEELECTRPINVTLGDIVGEQYQ